MPRRSTGIGTIPTVELDSIEIYWIGDDGRIARVQTYFSPPEGQALDPFFMKKSS